MQAMARPEFTCSVQVQPLPDQTNPAAGQYAWAYTVTIQNSGDVTAQLVARHWVITDAQGKVEQVRGLAVVGHQPRPAGVLEALAGLEQRLATPQGTMRGTFFCMTDEAHPFDAPVPEFALTLASALH